MATPACEVIQRGADAHGELIKLPDGGLVGKANRILSRMTMRHLRYSNVLRMLVFSTALRIYLQIHAVFASFPYKYNRSFYQGGGAICAPLSMPFADYRGKALHT